MKLPRFEGEDITDLSMAIKKTEELAGIAASRLGLYINTVDTDEKLELDEELFQNHASFDELIRNYHISKQNPIIVQLPEGIKIYTLITPSVFLLYILI